jgi:hypothetical protein
MSAYAVECHICRLGWLCTNQHAGAALLPSILQEVIGTQKQHAYTATADAA